VEGRDRRGLLAGQLAQEFLLIHPIFEGFTAIDKDDGDFVGEAPPQGVVGIDIYLPPMEAAAPLEFRELLLDNFTKVAPLTGIHNHLSWIGAGLRAHMELRESSKPSLPFPSES
jgi:hypothetical protein